MTQAYKRIHVESNGESHTTSKTLSVRILENIQIQSKPEGKMDRLGIVGSAGGVEARAS